jgi:hypothetical protein
MNRIHGKAARRQTRDTGHTIKHKSRRNWKSKSINIKNLSVEKTKERQFQFQKLTCQRVQDLHQYESVTLFGLFEFKKTAKIWKYCTGSHGCGTHTPQTGLFLFSGEWNYFDPLVLFLFFFYHKERP